MRSRQTLEGGRLVRGRKVCEREVGLLVGV